MKIYVLGSCSGTEPMEGRHHTSLAMEINGQVYFFDAGECCSYTAHLLGIDMLSVSNVFISHPHMDHIGGLPHLLWTVYKMTHVKKELPKYPVNIHVSDKRIFDSLAMFVGVTEPFYDRVKLGFGQIEEGRIFEDENIKVSAIHNNHIAKTDDGWLSYSFEILTEGKKIVYSGDIGGLDDILPFIKDGCDALFIETGHHSPENICREIVDNGYAVKKLYFMHHGRAILYGYDEELEKCRKIIPSVTFCNDKDIYDI